jgi:predicted RecA/RadA family phage recombinase
MRNFIQPGNSLAIAVPYATGVSAGQGVLVGALFGVAAVDGVQNAMIEAATMGVFDITKEPALAIGMSRHGVESSPSRFATEAAGPGNCRSHDPLATRIIPNSDALTFARSRQSVAARSARSVTDSSSRANRRSSIPDTFRIHSASQPTRAPISALVTIRSGR